jgi:hypothetical protein
MPKRKGKLYGTSAQKESQGNAAGQPLAIQLDLNNLSGSVALACYFATCCSVARILLIRAICSYRAATCRVFDLQHP